MKSTPLSLVAGVVALAAVTGFAALTAPGDEGVTEAKAAARLPVERSSLLCPAPSTSDLADTTYTSFTPAGEGGGEAGAAELTPAEPLPADEDTPADKDDEAKKDDEAEKDDKKDEDAKGDKGDEDKAADTKPVISLKGLGKPATAETSKSDAPALVGTATGSFAPGWAAQQTTVAAAGGARGLLGASCTAPDTDFWFPGASTGASRQDYVHLTNPDDTAAVADIELYGAEGALKSDVGEGITVPARSSVPMLISTLTSEAAENVTVHVTTRTGRVGALVSAAEDEVGSDWLAASADPASTQILPGIPADATSVRLVAFAPGEDDADVKVQLMGKNATFSPAGNSTLHIKSRMTASIDLKDVTRGEPGSLRLSPADGSRTPVVAALRVVRGTGAKQEVAFIPATGPVGERATVADNRAKGSVLSLTAPGETAKVKVTTSEGSEGGSASVKTYTVKSGTTLEVTPEIPAGLKGGYALTVESESGGPVHAARTLTLKESGIDMFTVQTLPDDGGTVEVPAAEQDLTVLDD
ncbi:DUF5719 family protein [Streptomyces sp. NPDC053741]|uniref:DUF5719 family protein n=1 Tax=Streptomyces TaxID=1883 RepID=UPI002E297DAB|nr:MULTISPECIES: DUF5719 family protein [Streptomyces]MEE1778921.1 DUF5719 family protein [Streptomyces sp. JV181]